MQANSKVAESIDEYIEQFPANVQAILQKLRTTIKKTAPNAEELISYQMPAFKYHGILVYFAGYKNHIGFYPTPSAVKAFAKDLSQFKTSASTIQFPLEAPLPLHLIRKIAVFRVQESTEKGVKWMPHRGS